MYCLVPKIVEGRGVSFVKIYLSASGSESGMDIFFQIVRLPKYLK